MRNETITIYQFSELSTEAKQTALEWWRNQNWKYGFAWADEYHQSLQDFCKEFNLKWESSNVAEYAEADVRFSHIDDEILELSGTRLLKYILNNHYSVLFEGKPYGEYRRNEKTGKWGYKRRSKVMFRQTSCPFTGYCGDDDILQPIRQFIKRPTNITFQELMEECIDSWEKSVEADCEYQNTEEYFAEHAEVNGYEFNEDGTRY